MRNPTIFIVLCLAAAAEADAISAPGNPPSEFVLKPGMFVAMEDMEAIDGDTIGFKINGKSFRIDLKGLDCPELTQPFGQRAKRFTEHLLFGEKVRLEVRPAGRGGAAVGEVFDLYEGEVFVGGVSLSRELLEAGLAWRDPRTAGKGSGYEKLEEGARKAKRGLWSGENSMPPWSFRAGAVVGAPLPAGVAVGMPLRMTGTGTAQPPVLSRRAAIKHWNSGIILFQKGDYSRAGEEWESCLRADPSNTDCAAGLKRVRESFR